VLGGGAAATAGFVHAVGERERAERASTIAQHQSDFLADLFEASDPAEFPGAEVTVRDLLDRAAARIPSELADQPAVKAVLLRTIGDAYHSLGAHEEAATLLEEAAAVEERERR
jgi:predicted HD phosphohydrolase